MGPICVTVPNFIKIDQTAAEIWRFNSFFTMAAVRHLGFVGRVLGPPTKTTWWSFCRYAKFGWNRCSTFDNMKVLIFCAFGLKTPIHAPKIGFFWGDLTPLVVNNINVTTKRH